MSYNGETYREFSRKPQKIALDCGCQDAADLFKKARNRFGMTYLIPLTGLVTGTAMAIQFYDNDLDSLKKDATCTTFHEHKPNHTLTHAT